MNKLCEICNGGEHGSDDHPYIPKYQETPLGIIQEHHNPLDIPFGHEIHEVNKGVKDLDEGGEGSGRQEDYGDDPTGGQGGELITFETVPVLKLEETINKQLFDEKLKCPCKNRKN